MILEINKNENLISLLLRFILVILFVICLFKMPYGYYQIIRFLGMFGFGLLTFLYFKQKNQYLVILYAISALLINPYIKLALGRTLWNIIDIIWALILLVSIFLDLSLNRSFKMLNSQK